MKKLELKISSEAFSDLEKIWVYTLKRWSKEQAIGTTCCEVSHRFL
jgi:plasmid stabilization system protein ParE